MRHSITETLKALREMQRQKDLNTKLLEAALANLEAALLLGTDKAIEDSRQKLLAQFEAGVDLKIRQHKELTVLGAKHENL